MFSYFVLFVILYMVMTHFHNKIKNLPPSPFPTLPIIGHLHMMFKKPLHRTLFKISSRHGPILHLKMGSRRVVLVSSPSASEECFTKNDITFANRPPILFGEHSGYNYVGLASAPYGSHFKELKRLATHDLLSPSRLQKISYIRVEEVKALMRKLVQSQNQPVDMNCSFLDLTTNVITMKLAGKRYFGVPGLEEDAKKVRHIMDEMVVLGATPQAVDVLPILRWFGLGGVVKKFIELKNQNDWFTNDLFEYNRTRIRSDADDDSKKTIIDILLSLQESKPEKYKDDTVKSLMVALLTGGNDTAAGAMEWTMSLLLNNPEKLEKARVEIDDQIGDDHLVDELDLNKLPYLRSIIYESLRMYPTTPFLLPHQASADCTIGGYHIPRGTVLVVNMWAIQNDPKFWEDPSRFLPERFEGKQSPRNSFKFTPFGFGRRSCLGETLALRMIGLTMGSLIQCFEWERVDEKMVDMKEGSGFIMFKAEPLYAKFRPRPTMMKLLQKYELV